MPGPRVASGLARLAVALTLTACSFERGDPTPDATLGSDLAEDAHAEDQSSDVDPDAPVTIEVTLDGVPVAGARVTQGGRTTSLTTNAEGRVTTRVDHTVAGEVVFMASVPSARIKGGDWFPGATIIHIALTSFDPNDNAAYRFQDPGEPSRHDNTAQCGHCHVTMNHDWYASPHRTSASNPTLHDLYAGSAAAFSQAATCRANGGRWVADEGGGKNPDEVTGRCIKGDSVLAALNPDACANGECSGTPTAFGACADCHAPGMDSGATLGGRDLRDATGHARDYGVHCDVCHKVAAIDLAAAPGVAGRLVMQRPSERSASLGLGTWQPLTFGPHHDVSNPRMGLVQRDHFTSATLCAGCHQYDQPIPSNPRWPDGRLPIHSTYAEWQASPKNPDTACQGCHMPPDTDSLNGADLQMFGGVGAGGVAAGWSRPPGSVKHHSFVGPRQRESEFLESAASLAITSTRTNDTLTARVTVTNVFPGHAIPTGEPLRSLVLMVTARCGDTQLVATGGDAIPDFGGAFAEKSATDDWSTWPGAHPGELIRVIERTSNYHDYNGFGPFSDRFSAAEKGMPVEHVVSQHRILAVSSDGTLTLDRPLPIASANMIAYRGNGDAQPVDGEPATARAGAPGFAFAKVLVAANGARAVPHFLAVDIASDNRLLPNASWTSEHLFAATCPNPVVSATLVHRAYPLSLATERGWHLVESVMRITSK